MENQKQIVDVLFIGFDGFNYENNKNLYEKVLNFKNKSPIQYNVSSVPVDGIDKFFKQNTTPNIIISGIGNVIDRLSDKYEHTRKYLNSPKFIKLFNPYDNTPNADMIYDPVNMNPREFQEKVNEMVLKYFSNTTNTKSA